MNARLPEPSADERAHSDHLLALLREDIASQGPMPFSRFMERCLYTPGLGYYSAGKAKFGAEGDFVTAPELGDLFAQCVVRSVQPILSMLGDEADFLELGGGSGAFAESALVAMDAAGVLPRRYMILEPSADLRERQRERLAAALPPAVYARVAWIDRPPEESWKGVLFANEVIDALPTTRFTVRDGEVYEEYVVLNGDGGLTRIDRPADALTGGAVRHLERDLGREFEAGYRTEVLPQLPYWMQAVGGMLETGAMLFIDYGYPRAEFYLPERTDGTLRAFYRHYTHADPFYAPGLQDLTSSVDFTALAEAGNNAGFGVAAYVPQAQFLIASGLQEFFEAGYMATEDEATRYRLAQQVKKLTMPEEMGERFQAMLFARGIDAVALPAELMLADQGSRL
ncbi:SAM-dependent MidA family methyltransferase [Luteibacter rhizovicinus]|uniref:SAM-dependent MidA family methyltransferase n=1 Tax=Luteibacter rhizovicinus TaxID=242606 RepID=A0A4R3YT02_9GAMM|nr:SAM-dependent methyltransferase [Luteibacter rhizovicinus]TCV96135.1 SAM-dependent MidA family methyltransferase [Luteibacter rhizovicinus]